MNNTKLAVNVVNFIRESWSWCTVGAFVGLGLAIVYLAYVPKAYQVNAVFQGATLLGEPLEDSQVTVERLKHPIFYDEKILEACGVSSDGGSETLAAGIKAVTLKPSMLISINYQAADIEHARGCLETVIEKLMTTQNKQVEITVKNVKRILEEGKAERPGIGSKPPIQGGFSPEIENLEKHSSSYGYLIFLLEKEATISEPKTKYAQYISGVSGPKEPVSPKKRQVLEAGLFFGLFLGGLCFYLKRIWLAESLDSHEE